MPGSVTRSAESARTRGPFGLAPVRRRRLWGASRVGSAGLFGVGGGGGAVQRTRKDFKREVVETRRRRRKGEARGEAQVRDETLGDAGSVGGPPSTFTGSGEPGESP